MKRAKLITLCNCHQYTNIHGKPQKFIEISITHPTPAPVFKGDTSKGFNDKSHRGYRVFEFDFETENYYFYKEIATK